MALECLFAARFDVFACWTCEIALGVEEWADMKIKLDGTGEILGTAPDRRETAPILHILLEYPPSRKLKGGNRKKYEDK